MPKELRPRAWGALDVIRCGKGAEGNVHAVCREVRGSRQSSAARAR